MEDILNDPNVSVAFFAFVGALAALLVPKAFAKLKKLAASSNTDVDDKIVAAAEQMILGLLKKQQDARPTDKKSQ